MMGLEGEFLVFVSKDKCYSQAIKFIIRRIFKGRYFSEVSLEDSLLNHPNSLNSGFIIIDFDSFSFEEVDTYLKKAKQKINAEIFLLIDKSIDFIYDRFRDQNIIYKKNIISGLSKRLDFKPETFDVVTTEISLVNSASKFNPTCLKPKYRFFPFSTYARMF